MQPDLDGLQFSKSHKADSAALDAITALRLMILATSLSILTIAILITEEQAAPMLEFHVPGILTFLIALVGFVCGAYGLYLASDMLGWGDMLSFAIIATLLIPYFKIPILITLCALCFSAISKSSYKFSLFGKPKRRVA